VCMSAQERQQARWEDVLRASFFTLCNVLNSKHKRFLLTIPSNYSLELTQDQCYNRPLEQMLSGPLSMFADGVYILWP